MSTAEPEVAQWSTWHGADVAAWLTPTARTDVFVIAVDGRSGGGKSTFAQALADELDAAVLHTDDFAWWHSAFDWCDLLVETALGPLRRGEAIDVRPPAWNARHRPGSILAPARPIVVIEGVGAGQAAMREHLDRVVWVQSDAAEAERRGIARDLAERPDPVEAKRFWDEWMAEETPFQERQATWSVANLVVCGTPDVVGIDPGDGWLCAPGPVAVRRGGSATAGGR